jgi:glutathione peroxidase-family protein
MVLSLMAMVCMLTLSAQSIYDFKVKDDAGKEVSLADYKGKVLLIVNTATRCGFTPQYKELEALYEKYRSEGLEILDFPCNQFGQQAPGTIQEIHQFCTANFDIQFPQFDKIEVNGANEHPLYIWLKAGNDIKWNFTKFLVSRDGRVLKRYEPTDKMTAIEADICMEVNPDEQPDAKTRDASKVKYIK